MDYYSYCLEHYYYWLYCIYMPSVGYIVFGRIVCVARNGTHGVSDFQPRPDNQLHQCTHGLLVGPCNTRLALHPRSLVCIGRSGVSGSRGYVKTFRECLDKRLLVDLRYPVLNVLDNRTPREER